MLHHHAGKWQEDDAENRMAINGKKKELKHGEDQIKWIANEAVRVSSILKFLDSKKLNAIEYKLYSELRTETPRKSPNNNLNPFKSMNTESSAKYRWKRYAYNTYFRYIQTSGPAGDIRAANVVPKNVPSPDSIEGPLTQIKTTGQDEVLQSAKQQFLKRLMC